MYKLQNGVWPTDVRDLDIDITQEATEFKKSNITPSEYIAARYKEKELCGSRISPAGYEKVWCWSEDVIFSYDGKSWACDGETNLGKNICQSIPK
ncbi:MAG: hypothetical protein J6Q05_05565 [Elusimicrobiaceae bacterium]|nr:hypothetical protein [Elusimicrobiaceae bacterium]